jgi:hypothetical protein
MGNGNANFGTFELDATAGTTTTELKADTILLAFAPQLSTAGTATGTNPIIPNITAPTLQEFGTNSNMQGNAMWAWSDSSCSVSTNGAYDAGSEQTAGDGAYITLPDFGNCSGLMDRQILNRIFAHIDYIWRDCCWQPEFGILGSIGFGSANTPKYWDVGARFGVSF